MIGRSYDLPLPRHLVVFIEAQTSKLNDQSLFEYNIIYHNNWFVFYRTTFLQNVSHENSIVAVSIF